MEFYQIERNFFFLVKANKIPKRKRKEKKKARQAENLKQRSRQKLKQKKKKKRREPTRLKTRKDGIGKIRAKTKQQKIKKFFHKK